MSGNTYHILVADDDADVTSSVTTYLKELAQQFKDNINIIAASSATDILGILSKHNVDVLFLDYHFDGGMNGDEIIDLITDPFYEKIIVLMSARDRREIEGTIIKRHKSLGARFKFIRKPFDFLEIQDRYLEIEQFFLSRPYPFPLAYAQESLLSCATAQAKITAMKDLIESVVKYSVSILMADVHRLNIAKEVNVNINWNLGLTLGAWLAWLTGLLNSLQSKEELLFMPELLRLFADNQGKGNKYVDMMYNFKDEVRDSELGHGYVKEEGWYASLTARYNKQLSMLFRDLNFTSRYMLLVPESIDFSSDNTNEYEYESRLLMGSEVKFALISFRSHLRLKRGEIYLNSSRGQSLCLNPFLIYATCETCSLNRVYLLENISGLKILYSTFCNHRLEDERNKLLFQSQFASLQKK